MSTATAPRARRENEQEIAEQVRQVLAQHLEPDYRIHTGKSLLYKIEVNALGKASIDSVENPKRGQYAFQTDILVEKRLPAIPLVVMELKYGNFSSHDVLTYSAKATQHKNIYPYLRYGFVVAGLGLLGRRFVTHNQGFDFALALPDLAAGEAGLVALMRRQIASAECLAGLAQGSRIRMSRYEEIVEVGA